MIQYPAIVELHQANMFFLPMALAIGQRKILSAPWGLLFRLSIGAFLSCADVVTDIITITRYYGRGNLSFARTSLALILTNLACQITVCFILESLSKKNKGFSFVKVLLWELAFCVTCVKPAVDVYRLTTEKKEVNGIDQLGVLIVNKLCELTCEAVPGGILQTFAIFTLGGGGGAWPYISILTSVFTVSYGVTLVAYDKDLSPECRSAVPSFYGE